MFLCHFVWAQNVNLAGMQLRSLASVKYPVSSRQSKGLRRSCRRLQMPQRKLISIISPNDSETGRELAGEYLTAERVSEIPNRRFRRPIDNFILNSTQLKLWWLR